MKKHKPITLITGLILLTGISFAQQIKFNLALDNTTFSFGYVQAITQDQKGYIWFTGFSKGLHRFDGKKITVYNHNSDNTNSLASNQLSALSADSAGNIWTAMLGYGLDRFHPETKQFTHFRHVPGNPKSLSSDTVTAITTDRSGNIWVGTTRGVDRFNPETGNFTHYMIDELAYQTSSLDNTASVSALYEDRKGNLWIGWAGMGSKKGGFGGLGRLDKGTGKFIQYKHNPANPNSLANNNVFAIYEDSKGNLWIGAEGNRLQILDRKTGNFSSYNYDREHPDRLSSPPATGSQFEIISFITEDAKGRLWIGSSSGGINMYDPVLKKTIHYGLVGNDKTGRYTKDTLSGFADSSAWGAFTSKDGLLWVVSGNKGIYNIDFSSTTVPYVPLNAAATGFYYEEEKNRLWIHSDSGIIRKNILTNEQKIFRFDPKNPNSLSGGDAFNMLGDGEGNIWIANHNNGIAKFNIKTEQVTHYRHDKNNPASLVNDSTHVLFVDRQRYLWIGTHIGLSRMDTKTGNCINYIHNPNDSFSVGNSHINSFAQDKKERLWIGTDKDIYALDIKTGKFQRYEISSGQILNICNDASGKIWATCGGVLFLFDEANNRFKKFTTQVYPDGFESILGLVGDEKGNLWLSSNKSIVKINKDRDAAIIFGAAQGVLPTTDMWMRNTRAKDGRLFLGSKKGYYSFTADELKDDRTAPILNFSHFKIGNQEIVEGEGSVLTAPIWKTGSIKLTYKQNTFTIEFGAVEFKNQGDIKYLYKLENYDDEWRNAGTETKATFFSLPPGKYLLQVKAVSSDGAFAEKRIAITITPPWWKTWWAYCLYGVLLILAGYLIYKYQRSYIVKRERERTQQKELAQAREIEKAYTQLKATQAQLIQSEKMASLGELTAGIAHEIQNPLNFVNNFSELNTELIDELKQELATGNLQSAKELADNIRENEEKIAHHGKRADGIVKGMLQHSRSSSGQKEPTDINALCDEYLRLAYHGLRAKDKSFNAKFETQLDPNVGMVSVLPQEMGRVILNLINNAFYAVNERKKTADPGYEPCVTVSTRKTAGKVEIEVRDNGTGIPQKAIDKIFQPFFTTKPTGEGTGLGLSLSYDIVTNGHGGELNVNTVPGEGTVFIIRL